MKQTPIEWMIEMLSENGFIGVFCNNEEADTRKKQLQLIIDKSMSFEKQQIIAAYVRGCQDSYDSEPMTQEVDEEYAKEYYYERFVKPE
jgi:hypothetical protein